VVGIMFGILGFLILFRYGMPFRVPTGGTTYVITSDVDEDEKIMDWRYQMYGYVGFALAITGAAMQVYAAWT
jgi:hypothetical protein